jgi:hypothetical protein
MKHWLILPAVLILACIPVFGEEVPLPLVHAHAHNDYEHTHPLFDALGHGIASVEADIHLVNGQLLVTHDRRSVDPKRTLQALYLDPLRQRAKNFGGRIYPVGDPTFYLLIDTKSDPGATWVVLREVLRGYPDLITRFDNGRIEYKAVTVVLTGNRPRALLNHEPLRQAGLDGQMPDLSNPNPDHLFLWMSEDWKHFFKWNGNGQIPAGEKARLLEIVAKAHDRGMKVRFWDAPQSTNFWKELRSDGVDLLNADDLAGVEKFLRQSSP